MNWERAKTFLLVAFLLLDLFLWAEWRASRREAAVIEMSGEAELLRSKFAQLGLTVPEGKGPPPALRYFSLEKERPAPAASGDGPAVRRFAYNPETGELVLRWAPPVKTQALAGAEWLRAYLPGAGELRPADGGGWIEFVEGYPLFEARLDPEEGPGGVVGLRGRFWIVGEGGDPQPLIPPALAVYALADRRPNPPGSRIEAVLPGYRRVQPTGGESFLVPVWRVVTGAGALDVNGFLGTPIPDGPPRPEDRGSVERTDEG